MTNEEIDAKTLALIERGIASAGGIKRLLFSGTPRDAAQDYTNDRIVDKSLQRLRRANKIVYANRAWSIVK